MCGICAYIGYTPNPYKKIYFGLQMLQNRGYDSMGVVTICTITGKLIVKKRASTPAMKAIDYMESIQNDFDNGDTDNGNIFAGHSRWRTCGSCTDENAHPHVSYNGKFALVHNGIIENYRILRTELEDKGIVFRSQTDSEVIVNVIANFFVETENVELAIQKALHKLEGTWGLVIVCTDDPDRLYCARHGSPLLIGFGEQFMMIASEQIGFAQYVDNYICLKEADLIILEKQNGHVQMIRQTVDYELRNITANELDVTPEPFSHWTLKEIYEQRESSLRSIGGGGRICNDSEVRLGGLNSHKKQLIDIEHLIILGCGTSYNAAHYSLECFRHIAGFKTVQLLDGANFDNSIIPGHNTSTGNVGLLLVSQSGETKDLHHALEIGRDNGIVMIGVVNVVDSMIAREVDCGVYVNAGREVGVASTKCFTSQVIVLHLIAVWFSQHRNIAQRERRHIIEGLRALPQDIAHTLETCKEYAKKIATKFAVEQQPFFILGKGVSEAIAHEASLKIKELSYIFCEAYNSSALKHGPYSCISDGTPIIVFVPNDKHISRNKSTIDELEARNAYIIVVGTTEGAHIPIHADTYFQSLLAIIPMQLVAYYTAILLGNSVDQPRGLAKTVTTF